MSKQSLWRVLSESTKSWDQGSVVKNNSKQALNLYIVADRDLSCYSSALSKPSAAPECGAHVNDVLETRRSRAFASCPDARLSNVFLTWVPAIYLKTALAYLYQRIVFRKSTAVRARDLSYMSWIIAADFYTSLSTAYSTRSFQFYWIFVSASVRLILAP